MNAFELLLKWPSWEKASPENIFDSPAWAITTRWRDTPCVLRRTDFKERDVLGIELLFEGQSHFLGLGCRDSFADLSQLWSVKQSLPEALKLALIEKECGPLLQIIENAARRQVTIKNLLPAEKREGCTGFEIINEKGAILASFVLQINSEIIHTLGQIKYINTNHPVIRDMPRKARACYAAFQMASSELASLSTGDYLLMPEILNGQAYWINELPLDDTVQIVAPNETQLTFAQYVDDVLPKPPTPTELYLTRNQKTIAHGRLDMLGETPAFAIEEVF